MLCCGLMPTGFTHIHQGWALFIEGHTGTHFTIYFSIVIPIRWKFHSACIQVTVKWSLSNFAHGTTAVLSCHVQNSAALWHLIMELQSFRFPIGFELQWKNRSWNGPGTVWVHGFMNPHEVRILHVLLNPLVLEPEYSWITRSIPWLLSGDMTIII